MRSRLTLGLISAALAFAVLAPVLGRGFVLSYDMVFAPRQPLLPDGIGVGSTLPRSVPADAVIALLTRVLAGDIVQKLLLFLALFGGALGAGRLVPTTSLGTRVVATVAYGWSAYVAERLLIGHWPYLLAYACLPWVALAALAVRREAPKSLPRLVLACVPACLTPTGGLLVAGAALAGAGWRKLTWTLPLLVVLNAPWWVPSVLHPGGTLSATEGVAAFSARAESWATPVVSLLGLGGIWNAEVTPASRGNPLVPVLTLAMVAVALLGLRELARRWGAAPARALVLLGAFGVLVAALGSVPLGDDVLRWTVAQVPGGGLLRDGQKWVAWWGLPLAVGFALGVERAAGYLGSGRRALFAVAALFPVVLLPDLALAGWGRLGTAHYPADWQDVSEVLERDTRPGDVLSMPLSALRRFDWNADRTQLDPAPRILPRTTVIDDTVFVSGRAIPGEDRRAALVRTAVRDGGSLGRLGIGWVLVEHRTPGPPDFAVLDGLSEVYRGPWLSLYRVPGAVDPDAYRGAPRAPVLAADFAALGLIALSLLWSGLPTGKLSRRNRLVPEE